MTANEARKIITQLEALVSDGREIVIKRLFGQFELTVFHPKDHNHEHHLGKTMAEIVSAAVKNTLVEKEDLDV